MTQQECTGTISERRDPLSQPGLEQKERRLPLLTGWTQEKICFLGIRAPQNTQSRNVHLLSLVLFSDDNVLLAWRENLFSVRLFEKKKNGLMGYFLLYKHIAAYSINLLWSLTFCLLRLFLPLQFMPFQGWWELTNSSFANAPRKMNQVEN